MFRVASNCELRAVLKIGEYYRFGHDFPAGQFLSVRSFLIAATT